MSLNKMWLRRQTTKFNGAPYIIQRGAEAVFSEEGQKQCREMLAFYKENARIMSEALAKKALSSTAAHIPRISGCSAPTAWVPGSFSIICWKNWLLSALRAQASVPWVKVISA